MIFTLSTSYTKYSTLLKAIFVTVFRSLFYSAFLITNLI